MNRCMIRRANEFSVDLNFTSKFGVRALVKYNNQVLLQTLKKQTQENFMLVTHLRDTTCTTKDSRTKEVERQTTTITGAEHSFAV
jgi:hypothetical protein